MTIAPTPDHPAFPQPDDLAARIWRYMDREKFEWLVNEGRLFMPAAGELGDPLEGSTPAGEVDWWIRQAENANDDEARRIIAHNRNFLSIMATNLRSNHYVSCWHMNPTENRAMWGCYTHHPEAVAIQTNYAVLRAELPHFVQMGLVRYIDYATARLPTMNMLEYITHKNEYYRSEAEVRAVVTPSFLPQVDQDAFNDNYFQLESRPGFCIYAPRVNLATLIQRVILHPNATSIFETAMADLCSANGLPRPEKSEANRSPLFLDSHRQA